ncbi:MULTISPECIES: hypothetical protein [Photobacterium]|uniref:hypothetical protein n=1 Tax=Photobacterium TaxID=657 RepID=UPI000AFAF3B1|nr:MULTISPECIES: hypothetical protein [Photobacterium]UIP26661.1 hypothetical protein LN341_08330 [Photobacterium sp. TLY01]
MTVQFVSLLNVRFNDKEKFEIHVGWLSRKIASGLGWELAICGWQSPSPFPNDSQVVHVWKTNSSSELEARTSLNGLIASLDQEKVNLALSVMHDPKFIFTKEKTY